MALVTGASSGIGAAIARRLAREGLRVVLVARREDRLQAVAAEIRAAGGEALVLAADLAEAAERSHLVETISEVYGPVDVLVNNAGFGWYGYFARMPWALAGQMIAVNASAAVHLTALLLPTMQQRDHAHIVNIGSISSHLPMQGIAMYSATKAFVEVFSTALYRELRGSSVQVSLVQAGPVRTDFFATAYHQSGMRTPGGQLFHIPPERVAEEVWRLLLHPRRMVYVPRIFRVTAWVNGALGWLFDWLGPLDLRWQSRER